MIFPKTLLAEYKAKEPADEHILRWKISDDDILLIQVILILVISEKDFIWYDQVLKNAYAYAYAC